MYLYIYIYIYICVFVFQCCLPVLHVSGQGTKATIAWEKERENGVIYNVIFSVTDVKQEDCKAGHCHTSPDPCKCHRKYNKFNRSQF